MRNPKQADILFPRRKGKKLLMNNDNENNYWNEEVINRWCKFNLNKHDTTTSTETNNNNSNQIPTITNITSLSSSSSENSIESTNKLSNENNKTQETTTIF